MLAYRRERGKNVLVMRTSTAKAESATEVFCVDSTGNPKEQPTWRFQRRRETTWWFSV